MLTVYDIPQSVGVTLTACRCFGLVRITFCLMGHKCLHMASELNVARGNTLNNYEIEVSMEEHYGTTKGRQDVCTK